MYAVGCSVVDHSVCTLYMVHMQNSILIIELKYFKNLEYSALKLVSELCHVLNSPWTVSSRAGKLVARSRDRASLSSSPSEYGGPMSCMESGRPSRDMPTGKASAGTPA